MKEPRKGKNKTKETAAQAVPQTQGPFQNINFYGDIKLEIGKATFSPKLKEIPNEAQTF